MNVHIACVPQLQCVCHGIWSDREWEDLHHAGGGRRADPWWAAGADPSGHTRTVQVNVIILWFMWEGYYWGFHSVLQSHERERKEWRHQLFCVCYCSRDLQWADTRPPCHRNCKDLPCDDVEMKLLYLYDGNDPNELKLGLYLIQWSVHHHIDHDVSIELCICELLICTKSWDKLGRSILSTRNYFISEY